MSVCHQAAAAQAQAQAQAQAARDQAAAALAAAEAAAAQAQAQARVARDQAAAAAAVQIARLNEEQRRIALKHEAEVHELRKQMAGSPLQELLSADNIHFRELERLDPAVLRDGLPHLLAVNIGDAGAIALAKALEVNALPGASLTTLRLDENLIGDSGALGLGKAFEVNAR
ncbi:hypothetical protein T492DRAFT_900996 [Pavlovales sp. CCMP2436]|nr:hypothetical protein T492DRAFT_900996 [Pavlovales sp. CCMP2436]